MAERAFTYGKTSYYDKYIITGSLAYNDSAAVEEKEVVRPAKKTGILDNPKKLLALTFILAITGVFVILWRTAIITNMNTQVSELNNKLNVYYSQNEQTAVMLDRTTDLKYVENVARERLNMAVPQAEQKVYIDVNIPDSVEIPVKQERGILKGIKKFINNCLEYLY